MPYTVRVNYDLGTVDIHADDHASAVRHASISAGTGVWDRQGDKEVLIPFHRVVSVEIIEVKKNDSNL